MSPRLYRHRLLVVEELCLGGASRCEQRGHDHRATAVPYLAPPPARSSAARPGPGCLRSVDGVTRRSGAKIHSDSLSWTRRTPSRTHERCRRSCYIRGRGGSGASRESRKPTRPGELTRRTSPRGRQRARQQRMKNAQRLVRGLVSVLVLAVASIPTACRQAPPPGAVPSPSRVTVTPVIEPRAMSGGPGARVFHQVARRGNRFPGVRNRGRASHDPSVWTAAGRGGWRWHFASKTMR